jgi:putative Ca2+/H+ antiporter (TMEM165/GDT1 family)
MDDWRVFLTTFVFVFLAELGDKTQLAVLASAARHRAPAVVLGGAVLALAAVTLLTVLLCEVLARVVPLEMLKRAAGLLFIISGVIILLGD